MSGTDRSGSNPTLPANYNADGDSYPSPQRGSPWGTLPLSDIEGFKSPLGQYSVQSHAWEFTSLPTTEPSPLSDMSPGLAAASPRKWVLTLASNQHPYTPESSCRVVEELGSSSREKVPPHRRSCRFIWRGLSCGDGFSEEVPRFFEGNGQGLSAQKAVPTVIHWRRSDCRSRD